MDTKICRCYYCRRRFVIGYDTALQILYKNNHGKIKFIMFYNECIDILFNNEEQILSPVNKFTCLMCGAPRVLENTVCSTSPHLYLTYFYLCCANPNCFNSKRH